MSDRPTDEKSSDPSERPPVRPASGPPDSDTGSSSYETAENEVGDRQERGPRPHRSGVERADAESLKASRSWGYEDQQQSLKNCKRKIREYVQGISAAYAAQRIRDQQLYKEQGYDSITTFIDEELPIGTSQWYNLLGCAEVRDILEERSGLVKEHLSTAVEYALPNRVKWTLPLKPHTDAPERVCRLWAGVLNRLDNLTKENIETVVKKMTGGGEGPGDESAGDEPPESSDDGKKRRDQDSEASDGDNDTDEDHGIDEQESEEENSSADEGNEPSRLEKLRHEHPGLLGNLNDGVARGLMTIAETIAGRRPLGQEEIKTARSSFESLSHREESDEEEERLPACITGELDTIDDREILIAVPTELLTPGMARKAVPVGVPQTQSVVGVPMSYFDGRPPITQILDAHRQQAGNPEFNDANESIDWADYTINPITGCLHTCAYCYARYQAEELNRYKQGFQPTFFPGRLLAFSEMDPPEEIGHPREKNVFVGSMSDVFGKWVPDWMIQRILEKVEENDGFDYLFLTKFPQKLSRFDFPDNAWVGTTVDKKHRVALAERCFREVDAKVKWLSCEPLKEDVAPKFDKLSMFDCVVIGAQQSMGQTVEEDQPALDWVMRLHQKAREAGCTVYYKENLDPDYPKELPVGE